MEKKLMPVQYYEGQYDVLCDLLKFIKDDNLDFTQKAPYIVLLVNKQFELSHSLIQRLKESQAESTLVKDGACYAMRIVHFDVNECVGSLTFDGVIPDDVKAFSASLHFEDFTPSEICGCACSVLKDLCKPFLLEDGHVECPLVTMKFSNSSVSGYLKSVEITENPDCLLVDFEFLPVEK